MGLDGVWGARRVAQALLVLVILFCLLDAYGWAADGRRLDSAIQGIQTPLTRAHAEAFYLDEQLQLLNGFERAFQSTSEGFSDRLPQSVLPLEDATLKLNARLGIYVKELRSGLEFGHNHRLVRDDGYGDFFPASVSKLFLAAVTYSLASRGEIDLTEVVHTPQQGDEGPDGDEAVGKEGLTVKDLVTEMIVLSKNDFFNLLYNHLGRPTVYRETAALGLSDTVIGSNLLPTAVEVEYQGALRTTPYDAGRVLEMVYQNRFGEYYTELFLDSLLTTIFTSRIPRVVGGGVPVAHKTGTTYGSVNDCGLVFLRDNPYILSVMINRVMAPPEMEGEPDEESSGDDVVDPNALDAEPDPDFIRDASDLERAVIGAVDRMMRERAAVFRRHEQVVMETKWVTARAGRAWRRVNGLEERLHQLTTEQAATREVVGRRLVLGLMAAVVFLLLTAPVKAGGHRSGRSWQTNQLQRP